MSDPQQNLIYSGSNANPPVNQPSQNTDAHADLDPAWTQAAVSSNIPSQYNSSPHPHQTQPSQQAEEIPEQTLSSDPELALPQPEEGAHRPDYGLPAPDETPLIDLPRPQPQEQISISPSHEHQPIPIQGSETSPIVEIGAEQELDPEVQEYMQRVEKDKLTLDQPIVIHGQPLVQPAHWPGQPVMHLPTTRDKAVAGLQASISDSVRWLATWCVKMFKKFQGRVIYSDAVSEAE